MINKKILSALEVISSKLKDADWIIIGSLSLELQEIPIKANDIDILLNIKDKERAEKLLEKYQTSKMEYKESELFKGYIGKYKISNVEIEIMCNFEVYEEGKWISRNNRLKNKKIIQIGATSVPVTPLEEMLKGYIKLNREKDKEKIKLIKEKLQLK